MVTDLLLPIQVLFFAIFITLDDIIILFIGLLELSKQITVFFTQR